MRERNKQSKRFLGKKVLLLEDKIHRYIQIIYYDRVFRNVYKVFFLNNYSNSSLIMRETSNKPKLKDRITD